MKRKKQINNNNNIKNFGELGSAWIDKSTMHLVPIIINRGKIVHLMEF